MRKTLLSLLAVMLLAVLPAFSAIPYHLGPESFEGGVIPSGWTQENVQGTVLWTVEGGAGTTLANPIGAKEGNYRAMIKGSTGQVEGFVTKLITPALDFTSAYQPQLIFSHAQVARSGYFDTLRVYYRVNATSAWQLLEEYTSAITTWTTETILLPATLNRSAYQLAFEVSDHAGLGVVLDDIHVFSSSRCQDAYIQAVDSVKSTSAAISFGSNGDYSQFEIAVTTSPVTDFGSFNASEAFIYQTTEEFDLKLTGLTPYTDYYVYVRTDCADNESGYTNWVSASFKTTMRVGLPYTEEFETTTTLSAGSNYGHPLGWTMGGMKSRPDVPFVYKGTYSTYKTYYSVDTTNYLSMTSNVSTGVFEVPADSVIYAATPEINGNLQDCEVDFWGTAYSYFSDGGSRDYASELVVGVMTDPYNLSTLTEIATVKLDQAYQFKHFSVSLSSYTGTGKYVCLASKSNKPNVFFVDKFRVRQVSSPTPTGVSATNLLPTGFNVSAQLYGADSWNLKVAQVYMRDGALIHDTLCYVNQTGLTAAQYQVQLAEQMIAGKIVYIYVQGVKNGVASDWSFPLPLHVPTMGVVPMSFEFVANERETFVVKELVREYHDTNTNVGYRDLISPAKYISYYPVTNSSAPKFDGAYLTLNGVDNYVVFPYVYDFDGLELVFRLSAGSTTFANAGRVAVGVMTDPYDLQSFTELARFDAPAGVFNKERVVLSNYTGTGHYVAIRAITPTTPHATYGSHNCLDNIRIQPISNCFDATDVNSTAAVETAIVRWNPNGVTNFMLKLYTNAAHTQLDTVIYHTTPANAVVDSIQFTGLNQNTDYYYSVQAICGTDTLPAEDYYTFTTLMGLPYRVVIPTSDLPTGWVKRAGWLSEVFANGSASLTTGGTWTVDTATTVTDMENPHLVINIYNTSCKGWLISPELFIQSSDAGVPTLSFKAAWTKYKRSAGVAVAPIETSSDDKFAVLISTDGGATWSPQDAYIWANDSTGNQGLLDDIPHTGTKYNIPLTNYIGKSIRVAFVGESSVGGGDNDLRLSDIKFTFMNANCLGMKSLTAAASSSSEGDITWAANGTQEVYLKVTSAADSSTVFEDTVTTSPYHLTGLQANTIYNVIGYQTCNAVDTFSTSFKTACGVFELADLGTETFSPATTMFECWKVGVRDTAGVGTTTLTLPKVTNKTNFGYVLSLEKKANTSSYGYGNDYYAIMPTFNIDSINKYQIVFDAATTTVLTDTTQVNKISVGVLTNMNDLSTFETVGEITLSHATDSTMMKSYTISFADYMGDWEGNYGNKVMFLASAPANKRVTAIIDNIQIEPAQSCRQIIDMEQTGNSSSSITLEWTGSAQTYDVMLTTERVNPDTVQNPTVLQEGLTATTVTITNLPAGTIYYAYVRGICGPDEISKWSGYTKAMTAYGVPFLETFDDITETYPKDSWKAYSVTVPSDSVFSTSTFSYANSEYKMSIQSVNSRITNMSGRAARTEVYSAAYDGFLQSPTIDLTTVAPGRGVNLSFRVAMVPYYSSTPSLSEMSGRTFRVYVSEDGGATFKSSTAVVWNCDGTGDYNYADLATGAAPLLNVDLSDYAGKRIALGFATTSTVSSPDSYLFIDSVAVQEYDNSCLQISKFAVKPVLNSVTVTWQNNTKNAAVVYEISDMADFSHLIARDSLITDSIYLGNLAFDATYYVRAKAACMDEWAVNSFKTMYGIPYTMDFDEVASFPSEGWKGYQGNLINGKATEYTYAWTYTATDANTIVGPHIYGSTYTSTNTETGVKTPREIALVSPKVYLVNDPRFNLNLSFDLAIGTGSNCATAPDSARCVGHTFGVAIQVDGDTTWTPIRVWTDSAYRAISNEAENFIMDISAYVGQTIQFAFYATSDTTSSSSYIYHVIDNIRIRHINPACEAPQGECIGKTITTSTIKWNAEVGKQYVAELGTNKAFATVLHTATVADSVYTFTNLNPGSEYYARVKQICSEGCESGWSEPIKLNTLCESIVDYPWSEDFDLRPTGEIEDLCWVNEHISGAGLKVFEVSATANGENKTNQLRLPDMTSGTMTKLALPTMNFRSDALYELEISIYRNASGTSYPEEGIRIFLSDSENIDENSQEIVFLPRNYNVTYADKIPDEGSEGWYSYTINFRGSGDKRLIFRGESKYGSSTYIDNLGVNEYASTRTLKMLTLSDITRNSLRATWTTIDTLVCHNAEVVVSTTQLDSAALEAANKQIVTDALEAVIAELDRETTYYIYVRTVCDGENGDWIMESATTLGLIGEDEVQIGDGSSAAYLIKTNYGNTYSQQIYTAAELRAAGLSAGPIQGVQFNYTGASSTYSKTQSIYIGTTTTTSFATDSAASYVNGLQLVYGPTLRQYQSGWVTYTFTAPYQWDGVSDLVVGVLTNGDGTHTSSDGWSTAGTTTSPDYKSLYGYKDRAIIALDNLSAMSYIYRKDIRPNIKFVYSYALDACPTVQSLETNLVGLGVTEAIVSWEPSTGDYVANYDVYVGTELLADSASLAAIEPQYPDIDSLSLPLTGLDAETTYYVYVRANCDARGHDDGSSVWSVDSLTTNANCMPVNDLQATIISPTTAVATWTTETEEQDKNFYYVLSTTELDSAALATATLLTDTTMRLVLDSLEYETTYYLYVQSNCGAMVSTWRSVSFTTPPSCLPVVNLAVDRLGNSAVRIAWMHAPYAFEKSWEVGLVGVPNSVQIVADTTAVFVGLNEATAYTAYVRALCAEGDTSAMTTVNFTTASGVVTECVATDDQTSNTGSTVPFNNMWTNSYTQMIYPASMIGQAGTIRSISFYVGAYTNFTQESVTFYMANTTLPNAQSTTDWVPLNDLVQVFHADNFVHPTANGWYEINLDTEFAYEGNSLALIVSVTNDAYTFSQKYAYSSVTNATLYCGSDDYATAAQYPGSNAGTRANLLPVTQFCFVTGGCQGVSELNVKNLTTQSATVSWFPGGAETSWTTVLSETPLTDAQLLAADKDTVTSLVQQLTNLEVGQDYFYYVAANCQTEYSGWKSVHFVTEATCLIPVNLTVDSLTDHSADVHFGYAQTGAAESYQVAYGLASNFDLYNPATYQVINVTDTVAHLSNLNANSEYYVVVKGICSDTDASRWSAPVAFTTDCQRISNFPWMEDFDSYPVNTSFSASCWTNEHTAGTDPSLFTVDGGTASGATSPTLKLPDARSGNKVLLALPVMDFAAGEQYEFGIDVYRSTYSSDIKTGEGLKIYISRTDTIDETAQLIAFIPREYQVDGINVSAEEEVAWYSYYFVVPAFGPGHILIEGVNEWGASTYFDNLTVRIDDPNCKGVDSLTVSNITPNSAELSWQTIGDDSVSVVVTDPEGNAVFTQQMTASTVTIPGLNPGTTYSVTVTQLCGERKKTTSFFTLLSVPLFENATHPTNWEITYASDMSYYYWRNTTNSTYILGEMQDTVFYLNLYASAYSDDVRSRLMSPVVRVPALEANESLVLDYLLGATSTSVNSIRTSTVFRVDVCTFDEDGTEAWDTVRTWSGDRLSEIPWKNSAKFSLDMSAYAGQDIRLGFFAGITDEDSTTILSLDNIYLRKVYNLSYDASACSNTPYGDDYFLIPDSEFVVGTTQYKKMIYGESGPDTLITMNLTVNEVKQTIVYDTICEGQLYDRNGVLPFTARTSTTLPLFFTSSNGCDSLVTVNLEVLPASRRDTTIYACKGSMVEVNGKQYYNSIVVTDTLQGINTCDSIVRTFIEFSNTDGYEVNQHRIICAGDTYVDNAFPNGISAAGTYTATVKTIYGCDSTVTIHMHVANNGVAYDTVHIANLPYVYAEDTIMGTNVKTGDYKFQLQASCGEVTLHLHVTDGNEPGDALENIDVLQLAIAPNPAVVGEPIDIRTTVPFTSDFRITVFDAVGKLVYSSTEQTLTIPGMPVAGYYTIRLTADGRQYQAKLLVK